MHPLLIDLPAFGLMVPSYFTMMGLAALACHVFGPRWAWDLEAIPTRTTRRALLELGVAALLGGHVHFLVNSGHLFAGDPWRALVPWAGLHAPGAIAGMVVAAPFILRRRGVGFGRFADALTPTIGVGIALARVGCFLQGCCYGRPCPWPWCVRFPVGSGAQDLHEFRQLIPIGAPSAPVHPLQLYFAAVGVAMAVLAFALRDRKRFTGQVALLALLLFSVSTAVLETFREDAPTRVYWGALPQLQWTALAMSGVTLIVLLVAEIRLRWRTRLSEAAA